MANLSTKIYMRTSVNHSAIYEFLASYSSLYSTAKVGEMSIGGRCEANIMWATFI